MEKGITQILQEKQDLFAWDGNFEVVGASAFTNSFDTWKAQQFAKKIQKKVQPDGYLFGVGCDTIFSLLALYPRKTLPKGIILVDIDPAVVAYAKIICFCIETYAARLDFFAACYGKENHSFEQLLKIILEREPNPTVKKQMELHRERLRDEWKLNFRFSPLSVLTLNAPFWMHAGYATLHQLAKENAIAILHADLFNPLLLQQVHALPEFCSSSNVIYLANASDHMYRRAKNHEKEVFIHDLNTKILSSLSYLKVDPPHENLFIDTTQAAGYYLRLQKAPPQFSPSDF